VSAVLATQRRARLADALRTAGIDALVLYGNSWQGDYLRYATDFGLVEGHGYALVGADGAITAFLESAVEAERAASEVPELTVVLARDAPQALLEALGKRGAAKVGGAPYHLLPERITSVAGELADATALCDRLLMEKLPGELDAIRRSAALADAAYNDAFLPAARRGRRQYELVADVEAYLRTHGATENFMLIGSGGVDVRGMTPPSARRFATGDLVTTELTPELDGYYAQICRTLVVGPPSAAQKRAFALFLEAMEAGIAAVRPGATAADVARAENEVFRTHGLGEYTTNAYTRVRGHGLGLFPDSKPHVLEDVDVPLQAGMTIVVHPNTYHPEVGYLVLGDSVIVTADGAEVLTRTPRVLFEVPA
jgi:Xaa-Pro aminopeptidase